ncbi:MAG: hypothetical protein ACYTG5_12635, partial [Planctomycetota bacterium]
MTKEQSSRPVSGPLKAILAIAILFGAYQLTMMVIRDHVDGLIAESKGKTMPAFELPRVSGGA